MALYVKALTLDGNRNLTSRFGGKQVWEFSNPRFSGPEGAPRFATVDAPEIRTAPEDKAVKPCADGALHALRIRDLPHWLGEMYAVVEMPDARAMDDKVYGTAQRIVRVADFDTLDMLVRFAEYCAEQGANYTDEQGAKWLAAQFPAGFLDGVQR